MKKLVFLTGIVLLSVAAHAQDCALNEEAQRFWVRANAAIKDVQNEQDYLNAADEFKKAAEYAPDCADIYYNIGMCYEKSASSGLVKDIWGSGQAIDYLKRYLELKPAAADKRAVQTRIYELEYKKEKAEKYIGMYNVWGFDPDVKWAPVLHFFVNYLSPVGIREGNNNQLFAFVYASNKYDDLKKLSMENYKTKEGAECLKFCVTDFTVFFDEVKDQGLKKFLRSNFEGDMSVISCCYYIKIIDGKLAFEFEPKGIHIFYKKGKATTASIDFNNSSDSEEIYGHIYKANNIEIVPFSH